jgi:hypothetical protein
MSYASWAQRHQRPRRTQFFVAADALSENRESKSNGLKLRTSVSRLWNIFDGTFKVPHVQTKPDWEGLSQGSIAPISHAMYLLNLAHWMLASAWSSHTCSSIAWFVSRLSEFLMQGDPAEPGNSACQVGCDYCKRVPLVSLILGGEHRRKW